MNVVPHCADRILHDTWVYVADERIHLFYLAVSTADPMHRLIGHAVSAD